MIPFSVLDLAPIAEGGDAAQALAASAELAAHAEAEGYARFWMAEHHNMTGVASAATAVALSHIGAKTTRIRIGAGGVMLPNHNPLAVAEQFGTLHALYGDRVDLGLGRAPGGDMATLRALRRGQTANDRFPQDVQELLHLLAPAEPGQAIRAVPGSGSRVPLWILGSSLYGAQLAAHLGLPYAFASHFAPGALGAALDVYRQSFTPSESAEAPRFMLAVNVFAAETAEEARYLRSSAEQAFANLVSGHPGPLPRPDGDFERKAAPEVLSSVRKALSVSATGSKEEVHDQLAALIARYRPEELILSSSIHDPAARKRSFSIAAEALRSL